MDTVLQLRIFKEIFIIRSVTFFNRINFIIHSVNSCEKHCNQAKIRICSRIGRTVFKPCFIGIANILWNSYG